jgi:hypothetical protein
MRYLKGFGRFWYDFIIGDDWKIAVAVLTALGVSLAVLLSGVSTTLVPVVAGLLLVAFFVVGVVVDVLRSARRS